MLLNPLAGEENTFMMEWLRPYEVRPRLLNVYILGDPSQGRTQKSDRTALAVIGYDVNQNFYLLDGYCHRMRLSERWTAVKDLHRKWKNAPGVQSVRIGWERYGMQSDDEFFEMSRIREKIEGMSFEEVAWVREGPQSKTARIGRLEPFFRNSQFWIPAKIWNPDVGDPKTNNVCTWTINEEKSIAEYKPWEGPSRLEAEAIERGAKFQIIEPIRRVDRDGNIYDLCRTFFEQFKLHPFAPFDDLINSMSRVVDMDPVPPTPFEDQPKRQEEFVDT